MNHPSDDEPPETLPAMGGGPPKPPKTTLRGLGDGDDESPEPWKNLSDDEKDELRAWLEEYLGGSE